MRRLSRWSWWSWLISITGILSLYGEIYGKLPELPSFRSHPLYISLSSSSISATSHAMSTRTTVSTSSTTSAPFNSENFVTAFGEAVFVSTKSSNSSVSSTLSGNHHKTPSGFPIVDTPREFTFKEIIATTKNFSYSWRVVEVDFGTAYQGFLDSYHQILVKRLGMKTCPGLRVRFYNEL
nr:receptor like protein kinase S.2 [Ipomoea batatas]